MSHLIILSLEIISTCIALLGQLSRKSHLSYLPPPCFVYSAIVALIFECHLIIRTQKSKWISNKKSIYWMILMRLPYLPVSLFINLSIQLELLNNHEAYGDETTSAMLHYTEVRITICIFHFICGFVPTPIMYGCTHALCACASRWLKSIVYVCN